MNKSGDYGWYSIYMDEHLGQIVRTIMLLDSLGLENVKP